ncbi:MAG TPA: class I SAM-dependent methyltransferase [Casimicrobiaceae bacterium]|nr:class I SAM-dependent methyltransferase [Casimicrobiaceae bacterium]
MDVRATTDPHDLRPSAWIQRFAHLVPRDGRVLDVAAGSGRHARLFASRGSRVLAVDRDADAMRTLANVDGVVAIAADIEASDWPFAGQTFAAVVVTNYLHRPLLAPIIAAVANDGVLLYETFAVGNEALGRPTNPAFLLRENELLDTVRGQLLVVAFEQGRVDGERPAIVQRIAAIGRRRHAATLTDR